MCLGSPLFLKNRFGAGYRLNMVKKDKAINSKVSSLIMARFPSAIKISEVGEEISY